MTINGNRVSAIDGTIASPQIIACSTANEKAIVSVNNRVVADVRPNVQQSQNTLVDQLTHNNATNINDNGKSTSNDDGNITPLVQNVGSEMMKNNNDARIGTEWKDNGFTLMPEYPTDATQ